MNKKKKELIDAEKKNFGKQIQNYFDKVKTKRKTIIENTKTIEDQKKKHDNIVIKRLEEKRKLEKIMTGREPLVNPEIILTDSQVVGLPKIEKKKEVKKDKNVTEHSNMFSAINAATEKYMNKNPLTTSNKNLQNNYLKKKCQT